MIRIEEDKIKHIVEYMAKQPYQDVAVPIQFLTELIGAYRQNLADLENNTKPDN